MWRILGPLLFLIYINDLCNTSNSLRYILFADDTSIFMSHKDRYILQLVFNNKLDIISDWLYLNKLSVNAKKTNFMMFTNENVDFEQLHIKLAGSEIKHAPSKKCLGITIDNK